MFIKHEVELGEPAGGIEVGFREEGLGSPMFYKEVIKQQELESMKGEIQRTNQSIMEQHGGIRNELTSLLTENSRATEEQKLGDDHFLIDNQMISQL